MTTPDKRDEIEAISDRACATTVKMLEVAEDLQRKADMADNLLKEIEKLAEHNHAARAILKRYRGE